MLTALKLNLRISLKSFDSHFWIPAFFVLLRIIPITSELSYILLAGYALLGRQQVVESLFLTWFFTLINYEIAPITEFGSLTRYVVLAFCIFSIVMRSNFLKIDRLVILTLALGLFILIHSIFFSFSPIISILKIISWLSVIIILILAWEGMSTSQYEYSKKWITNFLIIILILSLPILFIPEVGHSRNMTNFQGTLNHPQAFGLTAAGLCALLIGQLVSGLSNKFLIFVNIFISIAFIFFSGSRTAGISLILAIPISVITFYLINFSRINLKIRFKLNKYFLIILFLFVPIILHFDTRLYELIISYMTKTEQFNIKSIFVAYKISREVLYEPMISNILENTIFGIGFGIASDPLSMNTIYFNSIPISAPIEKGVLPLAIIEEIGFFGLIFFMIWILMLIKRAGGINFGALFVLTTFLMFNLGEAGLFSPNGYGLLYLLIISSVIIKPKNFEKR